VIRVVPTLITKRLEAINGRREPIRRGREPIRVHQDVIRDDLAWIRSLPAAIRVARTLLHAA
jgi:hypothetical protein